MIVGIPKEIKDNESRVSLTPSGAKELVGKGHIVYVQHNAGINSGYTDKNYMDAGALILPYLEDIYISSDLIVKVKEPIEIEYPLVKENQIVFTYFHFASDENLTKAMVNSKSICIAYETVRDSDGNLPLLIPMSEVAGRMAIQEGARFLEKPQSGKGKLLGGVPGVLPCKVLVLGGGVVGTNAALMAAGTGADVTICDISLKRLRELSEFMPKNVNTLYSSKSNIEKELPTTDLLIGAVLIPGAKAPHIITREMLSLLEKGSVLVDVAIDQGGAFETSHPTTHHDPIFVVDGIIHYCVANIPGAVPMTSTMALTNSTLSYIIQIADKGWEKACQENNALNQGVNIVKGQIVYPALKLQYKDL